MTASKPTGQPDVCHFICDHCDTVLTIPERLFKTSAYHTNCKTCNNRISIRPASVEKEMEILELAGCLYAGKVLATFSSQVDGSELQKKP